MIWYQGSSCINQVDQQPLCQSISIGLTLAIPIYLHLDLIDIAMPIYSHLDRIDTEVALVPIGVTLVLCQSKTMSIPSDQVGCLPNRSSVTVTFEQGSSESLFYQGHRPFGWNLEETKGHKNVEDTRNVENRNRNLNNSVIFAS